MENNIIIRLENKEEWKQVENLTREAFWNKYHPGCSEHYILHKFRKRSDFVKELDYVLVKGRCSPYYVGENFCQILSINLMKDLSGNYPVDLLFKFRKNYTRNSC